MRRPRAARGRRSDANIRSPCRSRSRSSNQVVGDLPRQRARRSWRRVGEAERAGARLVVTPELSLCGYPPEDLLLRPAFLDACARELAALAAERTRHARSSSGFPERDGGARYNALAVLRDGRVDAGLPQAAAAELHGVRRGALFHAGQRPVRVRRRRRARRARHLRGRLVPGTGARRRSAAGAQVLVVPNGSPYHTRQQALRREQVGARARENGLAVRLRESRRRPGRARVRRRVVRRGRAGRRRAAAAGAGTRRWRSSTFDDGAPRPVRGSARRAARVPRLRGAGDGRARLRDEEPVSGRAARPVRRHRLGADARGRRRRAGPRPRARA